MPVRLPTPRRLRASDERGNTSIEWAILATAFFFIIFAVVQGAMYLHARSAAQSAAAACAEAARGDRSGSGQGRVSGESVISQSGAMSSYTVSIASSPNQVRCTVTGRAYVILDLGLGRIEQTAAMPKDRVTRP